MPNQGLPRTLNKKQSSSSMKKKQSPKNKQQTQNENTFGGSKNPKTFKNQISIDTLSQSVTSFDNNLRNT